MSRLEHQLVEASKDLKQVYQGRLVASPEVAALAAQEVGSAEAEEGECIEVNPE